MTLNDVQQLPDMLARAIRHFEVALVEVAEERAEAAMLARTPTKTGELKASFGVFQISDTEVEMGFTAQRAVGIDPGRKMSKPFTRATKGGGESIEFKRRLGSPDAPRGITRGTGRELRRQWPQIIAEASERAGGAA